MPASITINSRGRLSLIPLAHQALSWNLTPRAHSSVRPLPTRPRAIGRALGQLYLNDGLWNGMRLLPKGWSSFAAAPATASDGQYGAHFWLNHDGANGRERFIPGAPEDVYFMAGHEGQYVFIIPSKRIVIVRTGMTRGLRALDAVAPLIKEIYDAIGNPTNQLD